MALDDQGYPLQESLDALTVRDFTGKHLAEFLKLWNETWWRPDLGWRFTTKRLYVSTGGWSGNEQTMEAIMSASVGLFWSFYWVSTRRGGHYVFELPAKAIREAKALGCVESQGRNSSLEVAQ